MIPKVSGMSVMKHIRRKSFVPIIIFSAKDLESDKTLSVLTFLSVAFAFLSVYKVEIRDFM